MGPSGKWRARRSGDSHTTYHQPMAMGAAWKPQHFFRSQKLQHSPLSAGYVAQGDTSLSAVVAGKLAIGICGRVAARKGVSR